MKNNSKLKIHLLIFYYQWSDVSRKASRSQEVMSLFQPDIVFVGEFWQVVWRRKSTVRPSMLCTSFAFNVRRSRMILPQCAWCASDGRNGATHVDCKNVEYWWISLSILVSVVFRSLITIRIRHRRYTNINNFNKPMHSNMHTHTRFC